MLRELLGWIADPNWPGFGEAWTHLHTIGKRALPAIEEQITQAKEYGDDWWEELLSELKENILEE